ncbi:hypothetical protein C2845_PM02G15360 [Panicum miliaceum]|uniref:GDSL esterase/lipase n=1 Tax=Panicum miliaceum TaxID=4540 RepID=A0A3L6SF89_PANMI|nr:hypothetical protein C2845_PM02G15360 [Panicum miliaceum]
MTLSMAKVSRPPPAVALVLVLVGLVAAVADASAGPRGLTCYTRMFAFGNSLTDTGNAVIFPATAGGPFTRPPYGQTYFGQPSGRASDGRLIIDFLGIRQTFRSSLSQCPYTRRKAQLSCRFKTLTLSHWTRTADELRVPQPTPYLAGRTAANFLNGTNFAVGGATALDQAFLANKGIMSFVPISLSNQTSWFQNVLRLVNSSSVYVQGHGEIGLNDYFFALNSNSVDVAAMIAAGARTLVVTGMLPIGCEPQQLALFPGGPGDYDPATGCIARFNEVAERHNLALRVMLGELRLAHPGRSLSYADIYRAVTRAVASPTLYGFGGMPLAACCGGGGGPYNFNFTTFCSAPGSAACADPS